MVKKCSTCKNEYPLEYFHAKSHRCKECARIYAREYQKNNRERLSVNKKLYYRNGKDSPTGNDVGYLYVISFSTGITKVGRSLSDSRRIEIHTRTARSLGVKVTNVWISDMVNDLQRKENDLVVWCANNAQDRPVSESFTGLDFEIVKQYAQDLCKSPTTTNVG